MSTPVEPKFSTIERIAFRVGLEQGLKEELTTPQETIKVGVSEDCYYETTPEEMQRDDYRHP